MTYRQFLIELCERKQTVLGPEILYFTEEDHQDLESWTDEECESVGAYILSCRGFALFSADACPWCCVQDIRNMYSCRDCSYGQRHGLCRNSGSDWQAILAEPFLSKREDYKKTTAWIEETKNECKRVAD